MPRYKTAKRNSNVINVMELPLVVTYNNGVFTQECRVDMYDHVNYVNVGVSRVT